MSEKAGEPKARKPIGGILACERMVSGQQLNRTQRIPERAGLEKVRLPPAQQQRGKLRVPGIDGPKQRGRTLCVPGLAQRRIRSQQLTHLLRIALSNRIEDRGFSNHGFSIVRKSSRVLSILANYYPPGGPRMEAFP